MKKNKSSIVRVIVSNYDDNIIKEIKVIHEKKSLLDTIYVESSRLNDDIYFTKAFSNDDLEISITDGKICVIGNTTPKRKYILDAAIVKSKKDVQSNDIDTFQVRIKMEYHEGNDTSKEFNIRREESMTERKFLDSNKRKYIALLAQDDIQNIDSKYIYIFNRFLSYRSNMLYFYNFVNSMIVGCIPNENITEIWKIKTSVSKEISIVEKIQKEFNQLLNKRVSELFSDESNITLNGKKRMLNNPLIIQSIGNQPVSFSKNDIIEILTVLSDFRHKLAHFDYDYFNKLFNSEDIKVENISMSKRLDLDVYKFVKPIRIKREKARTSYIDIDDSIYIFQKTKKLGSLYKIYNLINDSKNGFNKYINDILFENGIEKDDVKNIINKCFVNRYEKLQELECEVKGRVLKSIKKELSMYKLQIQNLESSSSDNIAYVDDIHHCKAYKRLYNKHQELINKLNIENNGQKIKKINDQINNINKEMKAIAKLNAKIRLEYKLRIALGIINKHYNFNMKKFNLEFNCDLKIDTSDIESIIMDSYTSKVEFNIDDILENIENEATTESILSSEPANTLFMFNYLFYTLLPKELRSDFLGTVKKHYYDIKNFQGDYDANYFHNLRLFEKNIKHYTLINYSIVDILSKDVKTSLSKFLDSYGFNDQVDLCTVNEVSLLRNPNNLYISNLQKHLLQNTFKYYRNLNKLISDFEVEMLLKIIDECKDVNTLQDAFVKCKIKGHYNFNKATSVAGIYNQCTTIIILRNTISHLDIKKLLFQDNEYIVSGFSQINNSIKSIFYGNDGNNNGVLIQTNRLNNNYVNDYFMKNIQHTTKLLKFISRVDDVNQSSPTNSLMKLFDSSDFECRCNDIIRDYFQSQTKVNLDVIKQKIKSLGYDIELNPKNKDYRTERQKLIDINHNYDLYQLLIRFVDSMRGN